MAGDAVGHFQGANLKTAAKLQVLEKYLKPYCDIMDANWTENEVWYVDTHAGSGRTRTERGTVIDGGALRAIRDHRGSFDAFYLYENDPDHFELLCGTIEAEFGFDMEITRTPIPDENFRRARHDPTDGTKVVAMEMDSNEGVTTLASMANSDHHWFVFIDPAGLTVDRSTLDVLIERGNADILINYQTNGVLRNAAAEQGQDAVSRQLGDDSWQDAESPQDYVDAYCAALETHPDLVTESKDMTPPPPHPNEYRFDLVFAAENDTARDIITDIWESDNLWQDASEELGDSNLTDFL